MFPIIAGGAVIGAVILFSRRAPAFTRKSRADVQLSPHFKLSEFLRSKSFPSLAQYEPTPEEIANLRLWAERIGEPLRAKFGPIRVNSGLRPPSLRDAQGRSINQALRDAGYKPAEDSDHGYGQAADIFPLRKGVTLDAVAAYAKTLPDIREVVIEDGAVHTAVKAGNRTARLQDDDLRKAKA